MPIMVPEDFEKNEPELNATPDGQSADGFKVSISISGLWNLFRNRRIQKDLDNIKKWDDQDPEDGTP
jgi:hypothetical protein